ncbi:hypothetical protein IWW55_006668, partial [Coemansia sp. RSA 2706]
MTSPRDSANRLAVDTRNEGPSGRRRSASAESRSPLSSGSSVNGASSNGNGVKPDAADNGNGSLLRRYPGLEQEAQRICLRDSQFDEEQVVRLLLQELHDRGFTDTFNLLQRESGFTLENEPIAQFRNSILAGEWAK